MHWRQCGVSATDFGRHSEYVLPARNLSYFASFAKSGLRLLACRHSFH